MSNQVSDDERQRFIRDYKIPELLNKTRSKYEEIVNLLIGLAGGSLFLSIAFLGEASSAQRQVMLLEKICMLGSWLFFIFTMGVGIYISDQIRHYYLDVAREGRTKVKILSLAYLYVIFGLGVISLLIVGILRLKLF